MSDFVPSSGPTTAPGPTNQKYRSLPDQQLTTMPPGVPFIIGNEAAERFSFYGMKAVLTVYLIQGFSLSESQANSKTHFFISLAYFLPVLGGILADWFIGKYKTILYLSIVYCLGHLCLAIFD